MSIIVFIGSCTKDDAPLEALPTRPDPVAEARTDFEGSRHAVAADTTLSGLFKRQGSPDWDSVSLRESGDTVAVFVPIRLMQTLSTWSGEGPHRVFGQLRASRVGKDGGWQHHLLTYIPEDNGGAGRKPFSGTVLLENWFGSSLPAYMPVRDGRPVTDERGIRRLMGTETHCFTTTVYAYVNGTLNSTHSRTTCITINTGSNGEQEAIDWIDPGDGGGGGPWQNPPEDQTVTQDITTDSIDNPCLKQTIEKAMTYSESAMDVISDIIKELDGTAGLTELNITVKDGVTRNGTPGEAQDMNLTRVNGIPKIFTGTIVLHEDYMPDVSQEGAVAVFIHEVIHAYLTKAELINGVINNTQHNTMAKKYVGLMANYLQGMFGISQFDAFSLAWSGLSDASAYTNATSFEIGEATYSKNEVAVAGANYKGRDAGGNLLAGKELCDD
ncbi:hypothetical protein ACFOET_04845 [Parapedobacter deserti]|uniref:Uncharacterized protein n=1 Tax=Parapedobacter deserti TaxID=1912957 RepID=A0ABV7JI99_9SPHI